MFFFLIIFRYFQHIYVNFHTFFPKISMLLYHYIFLGLLNLSTIFSSLYFIMLTSYYFVYYLCESFLPPHYNCYLSQMIVSRLFLTSLIFFLFSIFHFFLIFFSLLFFNLFFIIIFLLSFFHFSFSKSVFYFRFIS